MSLPEEPENIEDFYRQHFCDLKPTPSDLLWSKVENDLNKKKAIAKLKNFGIIITSISAIISLIYFVFLIPKDPPTTVKKSMPYSTPSMLVEPQAIEYNKSLAKEVEMTKNLKKNHSHESKPETHEIQNHIVEENKDKLLEIPKDEDVAIPSITESPSDEKKVNSFVEKIKKKSKDSIRPLFVPQP